MRIRKTDINKILAIFLFSHIVIWTVVPSISNDNLPLDVIEAIVWSDGWPLGWDKHPPLSSWFPGLFFQIFGNQDWSYYFLSQLFVVLSFIVVWKFSVDFFQNKIHGLISVLLLEGIYFYNFTTPEFNVNICQLPFWALTVYYCWKGIKQNDNISWLLLGMFAALGVLSKYLFVYLLVAIDVFFIYLIIIKKFNFKSLISLFAFFLVLTPHLIWLTENDYITFTYALSRTGTEESNYLDYLYYPFTFLGKQIGIFIPFFVMFLFVTSKFKTKLKLKDKKLLFLLTINLVPVILIFLTSLLMGVKIRTMWMTPFYLFSGVLLVYIFQNQINLKKLKYFFSIFLFVFISYPAIYLYISITQTDKRTDYPGKQIAIMVQEKWDDNFTNSIGSVIGDVWHAGNLSYHLNSSPKWYSHSAAFVDKSINDFMETIGRDGLIIVNGECTYGISFTIEANKICMSGKQ